MAYQTSFTKEQNIALAQQDRIALADGFYMTSGDRILETGKAHIYEDGDSMNQNVNWGKDDAFNRAIDDITARAKENLQARMENDPELKAAFDRIRASNPPADTPDPADLATYDKALFEEVSKAHDGIQAFNDYRIDSDADVDYRTTNVNEIGNDSAHRIEHDCETMSIVEVAVATRLSKDPDLLDGEGSRYFLAAGAVKYNHSQETGGHAYIVAANPYGEGDIAIIEATTDPSEQYESPYKITDASLGNFVAGEVVASKNDMGDISAYGAMGDRYDFDITLRRAQNIRNGQFGKLDNGSSQFPVGPSGLVDQNFGATIAEAEASGIEAEQPQFVPAPAPPPPEADPTDDTSPEPAPPAEITLIHPEIIEQAPEAELDQLVVDFVSEDYQRLMNEGLLQDGQGIVYTNEQDEAFYVYSDAGQIKILDMDGLDIPENAAKALYNARFKEMGAPRPAAPEPAPVIEATTGILSRSDELSGSSDFLRDLPGADVKEMQQLFADNGIETGPVDGMWGEKTMAAAAQYIRDNDLDPNITFAELKEHMEENLSPEPTGPTTETEPEPAPAEAEPTPTGSGMDVDAAFASLPRVEIPDALPNIDEEAVGIQKVEAFQSRFPEAILDNNGTMLFEFRGKEYLARVEGDELVAVDVTGQEIQGVDKTNIVKVEAGLGLGGVRVQGSYDGNIQKVSHEVSAESSWDDTAVSRMYSAAHETPAGEMAGTFGAAFGADPQVMKAVHEPAPGSMEAEQLQRFEDMQRAASDTMSGGQTIDPNRNTLTFA
jgi:hypothetical protein